MEQLKNNEIFKLLRLIVARKGLFAVIALVITTAIIAYSYTIPRKYQADTTVFIEKNVINSLVKGLAITPDMNDRIRVLRYALLSRDIVSRVLDQVDSGRPFASDAEKQDHISELRRRTNIQVKTGGDLFIVSLVDNDPRFARDYLNTLVSTYVEEEYFR
ncbi:MAG: Wzz/FepE/Etk N-terminal domain-containing protein [Syntrophotaleaceae bacterium]